MCDEDNGWVEAQFLDGVARKKTQSADDRALFMSGSGSPDDGYTHDTVKLG